MADPNFETNKKIELKLVNFDSGHVNNLANKALTFYEKYIYPRVVFK